MVQLGQARVGLAQELMKNSRASHTHTLWTDRQTDRQTDMLTERSIVNSKAAKWMRHKGNLKYVENVTCRRMKWMNLTDWRCEPLLEKMLSCIVFVNEWEKWGKSKPTTNLPTLVSLLGKEDGCTSVHTQTQTHTHTHTHTYTGILLPNEVCLRCSQARREGEVELSDAAIRTTLSGRAN